MHETVVDSIPDHTNVFANIETVKHFFNRAFQHHIASEFRLVPVAVFFGSKKESSKISSKGEL